MSFVTDLTIAVCVSLAGLTGLLMTVFVTGKYRKNIIIIIT